MSVGPFGPGGGIYSIIADAVYKVYFPNIRFGGPTILDICILAYDCGPCRARRWDIFNCRGCYVHIFSTKQIWRPIIVDICSFAHVCGPCRALRWGMFDCRGSCVQPINLHVSCLKNFDLTVVRFKTVRSYSCPP